MIQKSGMNTSRNSIEMENHVFMKAKTREEYLGFVARLILHVREMRKFFSVIFNRTSSVSLCFLKKFSVCSDSKMFIQTQF